MIRTALSFVAFAVACAASAEEYDASRVRWLSPLRRAAPSAQWMVPGKMCTYEKKGVVADPVLAERFGRASAGKFSCHMMPGQFALFKLAVKG